MSTPEPNAAPDSLALDIAALRARLGPEKVALIEQWIREVVHPFDAMIAAHIGPDTRAIDLGCSRGDPDLPSLTRTRWTLGVDVDLLGLRANRLATACVCAPGDRLPLPDASVDVLVAKWVLEHLDDPAAAVAEWRRVLRPGGVVCALTPNANSLFTLISHRLGHRFKQVFKRRVFGLHEEDTFPTYYRANTAAALARLFDRFETLELMHLPGMWTFFIFSPPLARLVRRVEWLQQRVPGLPRYATYIVGTWRKPEGKA